MHYVVEIWKEKKMFLKLQTFFDGFSTKAQSQHV